ncbi:hypothetical protein LMG19083_02592 [Ralstonia psammae]|uniref:Uncharacterized protein n=1 Tax=Ralstonia psammae TaxID=3058598 RepID=A0ABM9JIQ3_9RALS|nr:hypothetical protein [Ralstonia sp. LMG 19083]CAJ0794521.1 hypothetical protein LMG19083_02592 [Ralstonia sp. LMG 19083]
MRLRAVVLTCCVFLGALSSPTVAQVETKCESRYRIYFGNGIRNTPQDWEASKEELATMIGARFNGVPVSYANAINPTGGFIDDLQRVFEQKLAENSELSWELLVRASLGLINGISPELVRIALDLIIKTETESSAELKKKWEAENSYVDSLVTTHVASYTQDIVENGRRVLLVAHSQGNLYGNASHRILYSNPDVTPGSFGIVGVATPANYVPGGGSYVTSDADMVINALRSIITDKVLPANVSIPLDTAELSGHNFIKTYMHPGKPAREKIQWMTTVALNKIVEPKEAYDYKIVSHIASNYQASISPNNDFYFDLSGCPLGYIYCFHSTELKTIYNSKGTGYDKQVPSDRPSFNALTTEAIERLSAFDSNASNPKSPLNWYLKSNLPYIYLRSDYSYIDESNFLIWGTDSYDISGNLYSPPKQLGDYLTLIAGQFWVPVPPEPLWRSRNPVTPREVFQTKILQPITTSLDAMKYKAVQYEITDLDIASQSWLPQPSHFAKVIRLTTKICKPDDLYRTN